MAIDQAQMSAGPSPGQASSSLELIFDAMRIGVYAVALVLVGVALWLLWGGRVEDAASRRPAGQVKMRWWLGGAVAWSRTLTTPTRLTVALSAMLLGYHFAAWTAPGHILPFHIPLDLWFLLVGGVVGACVASVWMDRRQAAEGDQASES